jgi:hypothetical protein
LGSDRLELDAGILAEKNVHRLDRDELYPIGETLTTPEGLAIVSFACSVCLFPLQKSMILSK